MSVKDIIQSYPLIGIVTALTGGTAAVLAALQIIGLIIGLVGGFFGVMVGYYTWRLKRNEWLNCRECKMRTLNKGYQ